MIPGDIVTIAPPFGDATTPFVVSGVIDADAVTVWDGAGHPAYRVALLTKVGEGGEYPAPELPHRILRDWEFRNRFSSEQLVGIMRAAMAGDDVAALVWLRLSTASDGVDIDDAANQAGVGYVAATYPALGINPAEVFA